MTWLFAYSHYWQISLFLIIASAQILASGGAIYDALPPNAKLAMIHRSKYIELLIPAVDALKEAGLCIDMELLE